MDGPNVPDYGRAMTDDRPFLGVLLMLGFCVITPVGDALAKLLGAHVPVTVLIVARFVVAVALLVPLSYVLSSPWPRGRRLLGWAGIRAALQLSGLLMMFSALQYLPLADALAIAFVMPLILLLLGSIFLGEHVGPHRIAACIVGFVGTLCVVQPNFAQVGAPALLPLGVAFVFALYMLVTRKVAKETDPIGLQALSSLCALPVALIAAALIPSAPVPGTGPGVPDQWIWPLLCLMGVIGTVSHLLMTWSLKFAPSVTLAPMQYLEIPVGTFVGYLVFRDFPNGLAGFGICLTVAAGLYIIQRERRLGAQQSPDPAPSAEG